MKSSNGDICSTPADKANAFADFFAACSSLNDNGVSAPSFNPTPPMGNIKISTRKVRQALLSLDINKAMGPDGISPLVLKKCAPELAPIFHKLFKLSLSTGIFPSCWKVSHVIPVHKKGDHSMVSNYRPISMTSVISKTFESIINSHILTHIESNFLLSDHQYGFRKARSTGDLLSFVTHVWSQANEAFGESRAIALDISKAFDRVWHKGLLAKLPSFGFYDSLITWVTSYLSNRTLMVRVDGALSSCHSIDAGVPQGCVLSPTLFLIFINDLLHNHNSLIHSYADDTTLHSSIYFRRQADCRNQLVLHRSDAANELSKDIHNILEWGGKNLVNFNSSKTQHVVISTKKNLNYPTISMDSHVLQSSSSFSILGLHVSSNLSWNDHIKHIAKRASQKLGYLFRARHFFTSPDLLLLYEAQIRPLMEYCCHVWAGAPSSSLKILDRIQARAIRLIDDDIITSCLKSLYHRRAVSCLCLFYRYYHGACSVELSGCVPPPLLLTSNRNSRYTAAAHPFSVVSPTCRSSIGKQSFFNYSACLWNALPSACFPATYNLQAFKSAVNSLSLDCLI